MSFIAGALLNRRRERAERRRAALSGVVAPPAQHPLLGLGGRSIELSLGLGQEPSRDAVILAAEALHDAAQKLRAKKESRTLEAARSASVFLVSAALPVELPSQVRRRLARDTESIANMS